MASHKKVTWWQVYGSLWTAWWLFIILWITWYDYPRTTDIYGGFLGDGTWFWHEVAIPVLIWFFGMMCLMLWMLIAWFHAFTVFLKTMKRLP